MMRRGAAATGLLLASLAWAQTPDGRSDPSLDELRVCADPTAPADAPMSLDDLPPSRELVQCAIALERLDGNVGRAAARYEALVHSALPSGDPALAEALYHLAGARFTLGDVQGARDALDACISSGLGSGRCRTLRSRIDLEVEAITTTPVTWSFDTPEHGFFHTNRDKGGIRLDRVDGDSVLSWTTHVDALDLDQLVVSFRSPTPPPTRVSFEAFSREVPALLQVIVEDVDGRRWTSSTGPVRLPPGTWTSVSLDLATFTHRRGGRLDPSRIHRLELEDQTGLTGVVGRNELQIDDFQVE